MKHIRHKIFGTPSETNRLAYVIVLTDDWTEPLEQHPIILTQPDKYEVVDEPLPTDTKIYSIEFQIYQA